MAGLGFEMKKLLMSDDLLKKINAITVSLAVTAAPMLSSVISMVSLQRYMGWRGAAYESMEKFMLIVYYGLAFSFILSSMISQPLTRFVSDRIFEHKLGRIQPSFYGGVICYFALCAPFAAVFLSISTLQPGLKALGISLLFLIGIVFIQMPYLASIRKYKHIALGFISAMAVSAVSGALLNLMGVEIVSASVLGIQAGFVLLCAFFLRVINRNFPSDNTRFFDFLTAVADYPQLLPIGFFLALGAFLHCMIMWFQPGCTIVGGFLRCSPDYDVTSYMAYLCLIPMYVRFSMVTEVYFEEKYAAFYSLITKKGRYEDIRAAHKAMKSVLWREISRLAEIQLLVVLSVISLALVIIPGAIIAPGSAPLFRTLVLAYFAYGMMQCMTIALLYFDDRKGALLIVTAFNFLTAALSALLPRLGSAYFGLNFLASGIICALIAAVRLDRYVNYLEYFTFCSQPLYKRRRSGYARFIYRLAEKLNGLDKTQGEA